MRVLYADARERLGRSEVGNQLVYRYGTGYMAHLGLSRARHSSRDIGSARSAPHSGLRANASKSCQLCLEVVHPEISRRWLNRLRWNTMGISSRRSTSFTCINTIA